jgi:hypothetical protein
MPKNLPRLHWIAHRQYLTLTNHTVQGQGSTLIKLQTRTEWPGRFLGIISQDRSVSKSNGLNVDIF